MATEQEKFGNSSSAAGAWKRNPTQFHDKVSVDPDAKFPAEKNRYRLYVCNLCPWAHRAHMVYRLKGLEDCVGITVATSNLSKIKNIDENNYAADNDSYVGWYFHQGEDKSSDKWEPHGFNATGDVYELSSPGYKETFKKMNKRPVYNVPILFDEKTQKIVCNESSEIIVILNEAFNQWAKYPDLELNPEHLREEMKKVDAIVYPTINDGVYRCGFAASQQAYEEAYHAHWKGMDEIEKLLGTRKYLTGDEITLSDIRLFATLIRYDIAYFSKFKTSRDRIVDLPNMYRFTKLLYNYKNIASTIVQKDIVVGYYSMGETTYPLAPTLDTALDHLKN